MKLIPLLLISILFFACGEEKVIEQLDETAWTQDVSIEMNQVFAEEENAEIENYLSHRPDWEMTRTGTGLRYFIYKKSENIDTALVGDHVLVDFSIELLDGTLCYDSAEDGAQTFEVEKADIEAGLHEAMQKMCTGDHGIFILPSQLAHGLIGDEDKIPPLTAVIYDIQLLEIAHQSDAP
ncbi:MAG: FKBP-type peptidyl-prolyl cis-trans isomerase [Arenicella sp.]|jgi:FKBP-type peptidyl-prolyl cis-trans isomerase